LFALISNIELYFKAAESRTRNENDPANVNNNLDRENQRNEEEARNLEFGNIP
jgi:hypothetical protein